MTDTHPPAAAPAISLRGVHRHYGAVRAVDGVDLDIQPGEVFGLIGHNGAGKSTLFKMMLGLVAPSAGRLQVAGADVQGAGFREARRHIGYLPENVVLWDNLSGLETLRFFARLKRVDESQCAPLLARLGLADAAGRAVRGYSKGMRQRLCFAQALLGRPRVLFLDEPTTGLDPAAIRDFYATLLGLRDDGVTMVLSSHILAELQERVDRLAIIASGRVQALGSVAALRAERRLPLRVSVQCGPDGRERVLAALAALPGATALHATPDGATLALERGAKMALLQRVGELGGLVLDLVIAEPSLEELFFGPPGTAREAVALPAGAAQARPQEAA